MEAVSSTELTGWSKYEVYVLEELKERKEDQNKMFTVLDQIRVDIAGLKVKSGLTGRMTGLLAGFVPSVGVALFFLVRALM